jgi:hypothetical protein
MPIKITPVASSAIFDLANSLETAEVRGNNGVNFVPSMDTRGSIILDGDEDEETSGEEACVDTDTGSPCDLSSEKSIIINVITRYCALRVSSVHSGSG